MRISDWSADVCSSDLTQEAAARREALRAAIQASDHVYNCHGVEMNQRYASGAVVDDGSPEPAWLRDPELYHQASSRSEERRVGKECVRTFRYRWSPSH